MQNIKPVTFIFIFNDFEIFNRYNEVKTLSNHGKLKLPQTFSLS